MTVDTGWCKTLTAELPKASNRTPLAPRSRIKPSISQDKSAHGLARPGYYLPPMSVRDR